MIHDEAGGGFRLITEDRMLGPTLCYIQYGGGPPIQEAVGLDKYRQFIMEDHQEGVPYKGFLHFKNTAEVQNLYMALADYLADRKALPQDGQFDAQSKHLEDMRAIVMHELGVPPKQKE